MSVIEGVPFPLFAVPLFIAWLRVINERVKGAVIVGELLTAVLAHDDRKLAAQGEVGAGTDRAPILDASFIATRLQWRGGVMDVDRQAVRIRDELLLGLRLNHSRSGIGV